MEHPILNRIRADQFEPLGWFAPGATDGLDSTTQFVILIGNAGPNMFRKFARERRGRSMDEWTRATVDRLADGLDAQAVYPFDTPARPFLTWARKAGAGHISPLGLNIHREFGLWHAYRAALLFPVAFDLPRNSPGAHPCESCAEKPCLHACPVDAFDGASYDVSRCGQHVLAPAGEPCMVGGCMARLACPVGKHYKYAEPQMQFHMQAFQDARAKEFE